MCLSMRRSSSKKKMKINENIDHCMINLDRGDKFSAVKKILDVFGKEKVIVFFNKIDEVLEYSGKLKKAGFKGIVEIHSKKTQENREMNLEDFRTGKKYILLATDIASRGIDVPEVGLVINFAIPRNSEEYIHRIGRTGRAMSLGRAVTLVEPRETVNVKKLQKVTKVEFNFQSCNDFIMNNTV